MTPQHRLGRRAQRRLTSAIKTAEEHASGTATDAEIYRKGDSVRYDVMVDGNGHLASAK